MTDAITISTPRDEAEVRLFADILAESLSFPSFEESDIVNREGIENMRIARRGGEIAGGLIYRPLGQWFGGRSVSMTGIRGVGVAPEHRSSGVAGALMVHGLNEIHKSRAPLSVLYPATQPVYRRPGYEQAGAWITYSLDPHRIDVQRRDLTVRKITPADHGALREVYAERAKRTNGHVDRTDWVWKRVLEPRAGTAFGYMVLRDERIEGYTLFTKRTDLSPFYELDVHDLVALTAEAGRRLFTLFADHRSMCRRITWKGSAADPILMLPREQRHEIVDRMEWMLRIVDVAGALEARGYPAGVKAELHLDVCDDVLPHNHGRFVLDVSNGRGQVREGGRGSLRVDVRGLAPMYTSHLSAAELQATGYVEGDTHDLAVAGAVFSGPSPWMPDIF